MVPPRKSRIHRFFNSVGNVLADAGKVVAAQGLNWLLPGGGNVLMGLNKDHMHKVYNAKPAPVFTLPERTYRNDPANPVFTKPTPKSTTTPSMFNHNIRESSLMQMGRVPQSEPSMTSSKPLQLTMGSVSTSNSLALRAPGPVLDTSVYSSFLPANPAKAPQRLQITGSTTTPQTTPSNRTVDLGYALGVVDSTLRQTVEKSLPQQTPLMAQVERDWNESLAQPHFKRDESRYAKDFGRPDKPKETKTTKPIPAKVATVKPTTPTSGLTRADVEGLFPTI